MTLSDSRRSSVAPTSSSDFTPAHTTTIGVRASVARSADSSKLTFASRCTPPRPPVANTPMPARAARCAVEATVVAPSPPRAITGPRSRTLHLATPHPPAIDLERRLVEPDPHLARDHRDRRGHGAPGPHGRLELARHLEVARPRQPVRDQRALERDDRPAVLVGLGDLGGDVHAQRIARAITTRWISLVPS